jgi:hypothetical protein
LIGLLRLVGAVAIVVGMALAGCSQPTDTPQLIIDESVANDLQALALETWDQFLAVFQARSDCFGDVHLRAARTLGSRASYNPETAAVTVRVPATAAMLQGALVHEWAHHVEFQCEDHEKLWPAFLAAQGLPPDTPWRLDIPPADIPASMWPDIPSEQYAEATIWLVLGRQQIATGVRVKAEAVRVIKEWAAGD